jgi:hypothetical protein
MSTAEEAFRDQVPILDVVYSSRDFPSFFDAHLRRLKDKFPSEEYNDLASTAVAIIQIHLMSYGLSQLSFNLDRVAADAYLVTSRTLAAATRHTEQLGYKIPPASASSGDFEVQMDPEDVPVQSSIAKNHRFEATGGRIFQATDEVIIPASASSVSVPVTQGEAREIAFVSDGSANQIFTLPGVTEGLYLSGAHTKIFVNNELWTQNDFLTFETTNQYEVAETAAPPELKFGDGFAGNIPPNGATILAQYRVISGSDGNTSSVTDPATTTIISSDPVVVNGNAISVTVISPSGTSGGAPPQALEQVKKLAPLAFGSRGVAVTTEDYQALVNSFQDATFGAVAQGYAADVRNTGNDAITTTLDASIRATMETLRIDTVGKQTALSDASASLTTERNNVETASDAIETENTTLIASATSVLSLARVINDASKVIDGHTTSIDSLLDDLDAEIVASAATGPEQTSMQNLITQIRAFVTGSAGISTENATIAGSASSLITESETVTASTVVITTQIAAIDAALLQMDTDLATIDTNVSSVLSDVEAAQTSVNSDLDSLLTHLNDLFDSDCKANVVQVPILAVGADGFYTGPSSGLIAAVQTYLTGIKEVTQHVNVISGADSLLFADITVRVKFSNELIEPETRANIAAVIDGVLKNREFNRALRLSSPDTGDGLYDLVNPIDGIEYVNIEITAPAGKLDAEGNLIPGELEVITKGTVTITKVT